MTLDEYRKKVQEFRNEYSDVLKHVPADAQHIDDERDLLMLITGILSDAQQVGSSNTERMNDFINKAKRMIWDFRDVAFPRK